MTEELFEAIQANRECLGLVANHLIKVGKENYGDYYFLSIYFTDVMDIDEDERTYTGTGDGHLNFRCCGKYVTTGRYPDLSNTQPSLMSEINDVGKEMLIANPNLLDWMCQIAAIYEKYWMGKSRSTY